MLTKEQQKLITDNINFAYYIVNRWVNRQRVFNREDLDSIAREALCDSAALYDPNRGCKFINFAKMRINQAIIKAIQSQLLRCQKEEDKIRETELIIPNLNSYEEEMVTNISLQCAIKELPDNQKEIIIDHYFNDLSRKEIALKYGITVNNVKYILSLARNTLKEKIA